MDNENLIQLRHSILNSSRDADLYKHIGYFMCWFAQVEMGITFLMALLTRSNDFVGFDLISKGMDARVKCERLLKLLKMRTQYRKDSNLSLRLAHFEGPIIKLRNKLSHSGFFSTYEPEPILHFTSLTQFPNEGRELTIPETEFAPYITYLDLFRAGYWLHMFEEDIRSIYKQTPHERVFEIGNPRSWVPEPYLRNHPPQASHAKNYKPQSIFP